MIFKSKLFVKDHVTCAHKFTQPILNYYRGHELLGYQIVTYECTTARINGAKPSTIDAWQCFLCNLLTCTPHFGPHS